MSGTQQSADTRRVTLTVNGQVYDRWIRVEITRDLGDIAGTFALDYHDEARIRDTLPTADAMAGGAPAPARLQEGQECTLAIDGETVLVGYIDDVNPEIDGESLSARIAGRDKTGDLVDCAAAPDGPAEFRNLTLTEIARRICAPFGISVRAEVDVGPPFPRFAIDVAETAMAAIEKAARQRAVLVTSDGIGGLVLTRGGGRRGPAPVRLPGNSVRSSATLSWRERFSEYIVKGQTERAAGNRRNAPALSGAAEPLTAPAPPAAAGSGQTARERAGVVMTGRARDPEVTRYRPKVISAKTQSGGASVAEQAQWAMRVARAKSRELKHTVQDWRAGDDARLWRVNELVLADDPFAGVNGDMLVSALSYTYGEEGHRTVLTLVGPEAFDVLREGADRDGNRARGRRRGTPAATDSRAENLRP